MNRKREEELMQMAFGDLRREMGSLRGELDSDPESAKTYQAYCEMREGLKALREVPEMQMSTERLRDAILKEGLQPKRTSPWNWSWLATPIAVGACAFVIVMAVRKPATPFPAVNTAPNGSVAILGPKETASSPKVDFNEILKPTDPVVRDPEISAAPVSFGNSEEARSAARRVRRERRNAASATVAMMTSPVPGLSKSLALKSEGPSLKDRKAATLAFIAADPENSPMMKSGFAAGPAMMDAAPASNEIVQIESKVDLESGAAKATEVKGNQNVEIGG